MSLKMMILPNNFMLSLENYERNVSISMYMKERVREEVREFKNVSTKQILVYYEKGLMRNITTTTRIGSNNYILTATYKESSKGSQQGYKHLTNQPSK